MFTSEQIIGDIVLITFKHVDRYDDIGIRTESGHHFLVVGYDNFGIWVAHPGIVIPHQTKNDQGKPIPPDKMKMEKILIQVDYIY